MNIILEGPDATGKTTLAEKLRDMTGKEIVHFPSANKEDHLNALYQGDTIFDRFHIGEIVYPKIYGREPKLDFDEANEIMRAIVDNNDILIIFITSDLNILRKRLIDRGEYSYLSEIEEQNKLFTQMAWVFDAWEYQNMYIIDIASEGAYDRLDKWLEKKINSNNINSAYVKVCRDLCEKGELISGGKTNRGDYKELTNYSFTIDDISNDYISLITRDASYNYLVGELLWYWSGRRDLEFIRHFSKFWDKVSDDGETSNSAYGYVLQNKHGFNQIETIIDLLKKDPSSRRAVINFNTPNENVASTKDEICTICLNFRIKNGRLDCTCVMRSNDVVFGLTYDLSYFILLQKYIAQRVGVGWGSYTHIAFSMHMYERDFDLVRKIAYGEMRTKSERLNLPLIINNNELRDKLVHYVDNEWEGREEFKKILETERVIV